jgi:cytochrome P450
MGKFESLNFFTDASLVDDPHPYFEYLRSKGSVVHLPHHGVVAVVGYEEALKVFWDDHRFSAAIAACGPFPGLPFIPEGEDISEQIEAHRSEMPYAGLVSHEDLPAHARTRELMMGIITPRRLQDNAAFIPRIVDRQIDEIIGRTSFEAAADFARAIPGQVIADLLGVPEEDHGLFKGSVGRRVGELGGNKGVPHNHLEAIRGCFDHYISDRRDHPRDDVMSRLAQARYADGSLPEVSEVARIATFLFAAGHDTTVRLLTAALRFLAEDAGLQHRLRRERDRIPDFVEEVLRLEGTVKSLFRLTRTRAQVGDVELAPGTIVMLVVGAANRDPRQFERPNEIILERGNLRDHLAFGRGIHACTGAPLARAEARIVLERLFDRTTGIRVSEAHHGPAEARRFEFEPTFMFRGLKELHLEIDVAG